MIYGHVTWPSLQQILKQYICEESLLNLYWFWPMMWCIFSAQSWNKLELCWCRVCKGVKIHSSFSSFLARDAFVTTNRRAIAVMLIRPSVCPPVRLSGTACIVITVHFSADLSSWLDSPMFRAPWHQSMSTYSQPYFFQFHLEERCGMDVQTRPKRKD